MRHAIFANSTGHTANPGCQAVGGAIETLATEAGIIFDATLPVGYWAESFKALSPTSRQWMRFEKGRFRSALESTPPLDIEAWENARNAAVASDPALMESLRLADILLVNGEGSIHHNLPNALALLALIDVAADLGKPVYLINATIQALDDRLMRRVFPKLAALHVREPKSLEQVKPFAKIAFCAVDVAALSIARLVGASRAPTTKSRPRCLITAGVLAQPDSIRAIAGAATSAGLEPAYFSLGDGGENEVATKVCGEIGIEHMRAENYGLEQVAALLAQFDIAVSGRHHINLFLMGLGVPFVPLPSNTWKIEETLSYLGYPLAPCRQFDEVATALDSVWKERSDVAKAGKLAFARGVATLDGYVSRVGL